MYTNVFLHIRKCNHTPIDVFHDSNTPIEFFLTSSSCIQPPDKFLLHCYLPCEKIPVPYINERLPYKRKLVLPRVWTKKYYFSMDLEITWRKNGQISLCYVKNFYVMSIHKPTNEISFVGLKILMWEISSHLYKRFIW